MEWNDSIENPEKEIERLEAALKKNPKDAEAYYQLAEVYENINNDDKAITHCKKAVELDPNNSLYLAFLVFLTIGFDDQTAFDALTRFIELGPDESDYYTERLIEKLGYGASEFGTKYIADLRAKGKECVARTMTRWIWNP
ncbi:MAG: tetratricopeptide repeat protein [Candidatus Omnitrophica bacterium]|jgi:tetratricopeptide (TPR) repeat protein|nr:tetratricopeptide repeat protein [Candidatus Omnitrophota bacterium]MCF7892386.1 tetratricopeptide repeat protein [Candidatus Omnitrophota bacterium]MCF7895955.1 tetratricopeptide repeat protein [Candidatus Omnitrophota bacterium]MCF7898068.1 tetratricopeptide repeat protein [Candidatus Omnitrophota bacterium]MCF7909920.1 tetratricopeptide repeat protein [Candidatus Omnitrophota bacterium]